MSNIITRKVGITFHNEYDELSPVDFILREGMMIISQDEDLIVLPVEAFLDAYPELIAQAASCLSDLQEDVNGD